MKRPYTRARSVVPCQIFTAVLFLAALNASAWDWVQVSGESPFSEGCTGGPGIVFFNTEVEPWLAINPAKPGNLVGAWQQDRWSSGGANGLVVGVSQDGGTNFQSVVIPNISRCSGAAEYERASDPWLTFSPDGSLYFMSLSVNLSRLASAMLVSKSTDGGLSWSEPVTLRRDTVPTVLNDKNTITADPYDANYVYAIWDRVEMPNAKAAAQAFEHALGYRGPTWFSRTTDGGRTWEPARQIYDPGEINQTIGNQIVVAPGGALIDVFGLVYNDKNSHSVRGVNVAVMRSTDKGLTWSAPVIVSKLLTVGVRVPDTGAPVRTGDVIPQIAVDAGNGNLYVVWQDSRFNAGNYDEIAFSMSADDGSHWSAPIRVNGSNGLPAFNPSVRVNDSGGVGVGYYRLTNGAGLTDFWLVGCPSNCWSAASWRNAQRMTDESFDIMQAPVSGGYFLGDYAGLVADRDDFLALFSQPRQDLGRGCGACLCREHSQDLFFNFFFN